MGPFGKKDDEAPAEEAVAADETPATDEAGDGDVSPAYFIVTLEDGTEQSVPVNPETDVITIGEQSFALAGVVDVEYVS